MSKMIKRLIRGIVLPLVLLLAACSGPPDIRPPDRAPTLEGVIKSVDVSDTSIDIVALDVQAASGDKQLHTVQVDTETLILTPGNVYPQTAAMFKPARFVRVWLKESTLSTTGPPVVEVIEVDAPPGT